jgi:hypothetical protein
MMKKVFIIFGLLICCPMSYQTSLTNRVTVSDQETMDLDKEAVATDESTQEESIKNISKAVRTRSTARLIGRVIGIIVLVIIALAAVVGGIIGYVHLAFAMGWVTK